MHSDLFDGIYDNAKTERREVWFNGRLCRYAHRKSLGPWSVWKEMHAPWGTHPDLPTNASKVAA